MVSITLTGSDYRRRVAKEPLIALRNRFAERNPALNDSEVTVIARPALRKFAEVGTGHIRKVYNSPGTFNDDLFVVSGLFLHRVRKDGTYYQIGQLGADPNGSVSMAATSPIEGMLPAYLFIAEGGVLWAYTEDGSAQGHLQASGTIVDASVVRIGSVYYKWTTGAVDTGTPNGTSGSPWLVAKGISNSVAMTNMANAINGTGVEGTDYSTGLVAHDKVKSAGYGANDLYIVARDFGTGGNSLVTTVTGTGLSWSSGTLSGGGTEQLKQIQVPDDRGAISVTVINSYVIVVPVQDEEITGKFYWIAPGEITIDPLDYATAERSPDAIHQALTFGDMFWLFGQRTVEPWVTTTSEDFPLQRFTGIIFDRGSWEGTAVNVKDQLIVCDEEGGVFLIHNGQQRISRPDIEERIRRAILKQKLYS